MGDVKRQFSIELEVEDTWFVEEIWPDGDAPENPTVEDVRRALLYNDGRWLSGSALVQRLEDYGLLDISADDVRITDQTAFVERMARLSKGSKDAG